MKSKIKITGIVLLVLFILIQFVPTNHNQSDVDENSDFVIIYDSSIEIKQLLEVSCYDCHSNNTVYPWYNKIQPIAYLLENHISEGKEELNFNEFGNYSDRRKKSKLKSIISQIEKDRMPLWSYTLIHSEAKLTKEQKQKLISWLNDLRDSI
ncbi:heme-binding domain-containing protein [Lutibacter sp.]